MILVFILFSFFIVGEILKPSGGYVQGKGILIAGMAPDLSYDSRSKLNKISRQYVLLKYFSFSFVSCVEILVFISF